MTVLVAYQGAIGADSLVNGEYSESLPKLFKFRDGRVLAGCGDYWTVVAFRDWYTNRRRKPPEISEKDGDADFGAIVLLKDGKVEAWANTHTPIVYGDKRPVLMGTGSKFAMGALMNGADIQTALAIACVLDTSCGGPVIVYRNPRLKKETYHVEDLVPAGGPGTVPRHFATK